MSEKTKLVPKRRFKEFQTAGEWEERKLGDLGSVAMNRRIFKQQTENHGDVPFYKIGTFGSEPDAFISRELFEEYKSKYPYPETGDVLISASGSIGRTVVYGGKDEYFQDSNIVWLQHDERLVNIFLKQFYSVVKWSGLEGSTIKRLYNKNILDTPISLPKPEEQKEIGQFFRKLDNLITLHQRKMEKMKALKSAYLSEMFPAEGERKPKRRFAGFTGAWEQRKLSEVGELKNGMNFSKDSMGHGYPFVNLQDVFGRNILDELELNLAESTEIQRKTYSLEKGDVLFIRSSVKPEGVGEAAIVPKTFENTTYSGFIIRFRPYENMSEGFNAVVYSTQYIRKQILMGATSSANTNINQQALQNIQISIPEEKEQEQIGAFFSNLDNLITLHQRKLEKLQNIKQAYLNEMFL